MRTISIINLKGGVGKTVTSINMACELARRGRGVLLIDCDKQGNTSKFMGCHSYEKKSLSDILLGTAGIMEAVVDKPFAGLQVSVVPANMTLLNADRQILLDTTRPQQTRVRDALVQAADKYDYCVIDCAPDVNISVINALVASDDVIIPVTIDEFAFDGIMEILGQIADVRKYYNPKLNFAGCLVTSYRDDDFHNDGVRALQSLCKNVFSTKIRWTQMVSKSTFVREPVFEYSPRCGAAKCYRSFVEEYEGRIAENG